jgi:hypothetical protein
MRFARLTHIGALAAVGVSLIGSLVAAAPSASGSLVDFDTIYTYYSDSTYSTVVGKFDDGPCRTIEQGIKTQWVKTSRYYC